MMTNWPHLGTSTGTHGLHRAHPSSGLLLLVTVLSVAFSSDSLISRAVSLILVFVLALWSGETPRTWLRSLRFVAVFSVVLFLAQALSVRHGTVLLRFGVPITTGGLAAGAGMALRFLVILSASFLYALVTDPDALTGMLIRWGIPYRYGFTLTLALRFVPFFRNELRTVREAQQCRGVSVSVRSIGGLRRAIHYTFVPVLVSGLIRVDTIAMSMKGRGFGLHPQRTPHPRRSFSVADVAVWASCCAMLVVAVLAWRGQWI